MRMLRLTCAALIALALTIPAARAQSYIDMSGLSPAAAMSGTDLVECNQPSVQDAAGQTTHKCTAAQVATYVASTIPGGTGTVTTTGTPATGNLTKFSGATSIVNGDLSGDCTTSGTLAVTCTKTSGTALGTFATANAATPPAIGGTTPAAGSFSTVNGNTFTTGTYTLTGVAAKTLTFNNSLTLAGTDSTTMTFPATSGTVDVLNNAQTFTAAKTFTNSDLLLLGSATGATTFTSANSGASNFTITIPAATDTLDLLGTAQTFTAVKTFTNSDLCLLGSSTGCTTFTSANAGASNFTLTFPAATDTVADLAGAQAFTNKTYNGNTWTAGTGTLTLAAGKTLTANNSLTLAGTDSTTMTFQATTGTVDVLNNAQTFTAVKTFTNSDLALLGSSTGATTFTSANAGASNFTITIPAVTDTLATLATSQTFTATQTFNGTLAGTAFASPPAIGGTAPAAGSFTALSSTTGIQSKGTTFTLGTGTGACATSSTLTGGATAGSFLCTGTAGASTQVINLPAVTNGWACSASDITSGVVWAQGSPTATNSCKISGTLTTTSDKVVFAAVGY